MELAWPNGSIHPVSPALFEASSFFDMDEVNNLYNDRGVFFFQSWILNIPFSLSFELLFCWSAGLPPQASCVSFVQPFWIDVTRNKLVYRVSYRKVKQACVCVCVCVCEEQLSPKRENGERKTFHPRPHTFTHAKDKDR